MKLFSRIRRKRQERTAEALEPVGCVAIILDGNGRWAMSRGLPVTEGHREGTRALRRTVEAAIDLHIGSLVVYGFSTENWTRPPDEVDSLMEIFSETIDRELPDLAKQGVRVRFLGRRDRDPDLLIRTAGDQRISNFLLWQLAYAELVFVEKPWPDFGEEDLRAALAEYANRERRFGGR